MGVGDDELVRPLHILAEVEGPDFEVLPLVLLEELLVDLVGVEQEEDGDGKQSQ